MKGRDVTEEDQEEEQVVLVLLEHHSEAEEEDVCNIIQEEETKPTKEDKSEQTEPETSDITYTPQSPPSSTVLTESPVSSLLRRHHLSFKETIQNLHLGRPMPGNLQEKKMVKKKRKLMKELFGKDTLTEQ
ncbi:hypothetical protein GN956_G8527 [Arapaima gigas]